MATLTARLGLRKPAPTDLIDVTKDISDNMAILDTAAPPDGSVTDIKLAANLPRGILGYAQVTTNQNGIGTAPIDLIGLSVTVTVGTGRRIRVSAQVRANKATGGATWVDVSIKEGATNLQSGVITPGGDGYFTLHNPSVVLTPTAGAHTYKLSGVCNTGTFNAQGDPLFPMFILVEDIGAA